MEVSVVIYVGIMVLVTHAWNESLTPIISMRFSRLYNCHPQDFCICRVCDGLHSVDLKSREGIQGFPTPFERSVFVSRSISDEQLWFSYINFR